MCIVAYPEDPASDEADECVIPIFNEFSDADLSSLALKRQCDRQETDFVKTPSLTKLACNQIDTVGSLMYQGQATI